MTPGNPHFGIESTNFYFLLFLRSFNMSFIVDKVRNGSEPFKKRK